MHTIAIEIERQGVSTDHQLETNTVYLASCENEPVLDISIPCDQAEFEKRKEMLRYTNPDPSSIKSGFLFLQSMSTKLLDDIRPLAILGNKEEEDWLHVRLIVSAKELIQIPFELALTPIGFKGQHLKPFLLNPQRLTTLTREVKQSGKPGYTWPMNPHILFAWANPDQEVPYEEHFNALRDIARQIVEPLKDNPEPIPDIGRLITVLKKASLKTINAAIQEGIKSNRPFTHIHLLAHGSKNAIPGIPEEFRLMLHDSSDPSKPALVTGEELAMAILETETNHSLFPAIVSLMACDTANTGSISIPAGSIAHQLHESGIPCVFASQFPLSVAGSVRLVETLYAKLLFDGEDPRKALYYTRKAIADQEIHDWASLVAYIRFPENIDGQLKDYRLKVLLDSLKTSNVWAEHVLKYRTEMKPEVFENVLEDISDRLNDSIEKLLKLISPENPAAVDLDRYAEHSGLLGSAFKRKAEHLFHLSGFHPETASSLIRESIESIKSACDWYYNGYKKHLRNHWTGIQYLSLAAVTKSSLRAEDDQDIWTHVKILAQADDNAGEKAMTQIWAWGTLTELFLLRPLTVPIEKFDETVISALAKAKEYAGKLKQAGSVFIADPGISREDIQFAQESTARQLDRYISWWPVMMPGESLNKLKALAVEIKQQL